MVVNMIENINFSSSSSRYGCEVCGLIITEQYYLQVGNKKLHSFCLKCKKCTKILSKENSCYEKYKDIFCKQCYLQMVALPSCMGCNKTIETSDLVMQAKEFFYHVNCFRCSFCFLLLQKGNKFGLRNRQLYCEEHYVNYSNLVDTQRITTKNPIKIEHVIKDEEQQEKQEIKSCSRLPSDTSSCNSLDSFSYQPIPSNDNTFKNEPEMKISVFTTNPEQMFGKVQEILNPHNFIDIHGKGNDKNISAFSSQITTNNTLGGGDNYNHHQRQVLSENTPESSMHSSSSSGEDEMKYDNDDSSRKFERVGRSRSKDGKPKRIRTTFKQSQLLAMKDLFDVDKNPDAKSLGELSEKTHLTKRVLQVWFQNARAKHRKGLNILGDSFTLRSNLDEKDDDMMMMESSSPQSADTRSLLTRSQTLLNETGGNYS